MKSKQREQSYEERRALLKHFPNSFDCYLNAIQYTALKLLLSFIGKKTKTQCSTCSSLFTELLSLKLHFCIWNESNCKNEYSRIAILFEQLIVFLINCVGKVFQVYYHLLVKTQSCSSICRNSKTNSYYGRLLVVSKISLPPPPLLLPKNKLFFRFAFFFSLALIFLE